VTRRRLIRPAAPVDRLIVLGMIVLVGVGLLTVTLGSAYRAYRFAHHSVRVDALILDSDLGCFGPYGSGSGLGSKSSITYSVEFPYAGGTHRTKVRRPCDVYPPGFGRGRGRIWVEYDRANPDRVRVQLDDRDRVRARSAGVGLVAYAAAVLGLVAVRRSPGPAAAAPSAPWSHRPG
jgi:hypothetical protein